MANHSAIRAVLAFAGALMVLAACGSSATSATDKPVTPPVPTPAAVASVSVALSAASAIVAQTVQATVVTRDAAGTVLTGRAVSWSSSAASVASVSSSGLVTALVPGITQISATSEGVTATQPFTALSVASLVDSVSLSIDSAEVTVGDTLRLFAVPRNANGQPVSGVPLFWTSSNPAVATVSSQGLVTSLAIGEAEIAVDIAPPAITSVAGGFTAAVSSMRGRSRGKIYGTPVLTITPGNRTVDLGENVMYTARVTNKAGALMGNVAIQWRSTVGAVATIDQTGLAKPLKKGTTAITAVIITGVAHEFSPVGVSLQVTVCSGLLDLTTWDATVSSTYTDNKEIDDFGSHYSYSIDQNSAGTALLVRDNSLSNSDSTVWKGAPTGTVHINDKVVQSEGGKQLGTTTETGDGAQISALAQVRLSARWTAETGCSYSVRYQDAGSYRHVEVPKPPGVDFTLQFSLGIAADRQHAAGIKPDGGWAFSASPSVKTFLFPDGGDDDFGLPFTTYYVPLPAVPATLLQFLNGGPAGNARFTYSLVGH